MSKNKSVKSNLSMTSPKGSLIAEINNLRKELKETKQTKKQSLVLSEKPMKDLFSYMNKKSPQQKCPTSIGSITKEKFFKGSNDFTSPTKSKIPKIVDIETEKSLFEGDKKQKIPKQQDKAILEEQQQIISITINQVWLKERDRKLKLDIELNKLRKTIMKLGPQEIAQQLNFIISLVNVSTRDYVNRIEFLERNQKTDQSDESLLIKRQQEEIDILTKKIMDYEDQLRNLKDQIKLKKLAEFSLENLNKINTAEKNDLVTRTQALDQIIKELQQKSIQLEEENKILQTKLLKKEQQLLLLNQDINYLRIETENYKQQKKQFSDLYENNLCQLRESKRAKNLQIEKLQQEKDKWQKQCKLRRNESEQITALQEQKLTLMKGLSEMRHLCNLKNSQLEDKKAVNHENQKKIIQLESELYKLRSQVQTLRNEKEFIEFENQKIKQQFQDLKRFTKKGESRQRQYLKTRNKIQSEQELQSSLKQKPVQKVKQTFTEIQQTQLSLHQKEERRQVYSKKLKDKEEKLRALQDIHTLIKKHRTEMQI